MTDTQRLDDMVEGKPTTDARAGSGFNGYSLAAAAYHMEYSDRVYKPYSSMPPPMDLTAEHIVWPKRED